MFLDGVGLGAAAASNPFLRVPTPGLSGLTGGPFTDELGERAAADTVFRKLDATLGVPGLPQSATGQSTLLTGRDAVRAMGGHHGPWPGPTLRRLLSEGNLFSELAAGGRSATIANLYPPGYFRALESGRLRVNAPVHAALAAGIQLRGLERFEQGEAVSADLTGSYLRNLFPGSRSVSAEQSAADLLKIAARHDFTFFDYWLSDQVGHRGTMEDAERLVTELDAFLGAVFRGAGTDLTVMLTSDHGNLEDKGVRTHTLAPVPLLVSGARADVFAGVSDLLGVAPAVRELLHL